MTWPSICTAEVVARRAQSGATCMSWRLTFRARSLLRVLLRSARRAGSMKIVPTPLNRHQSAMVAAMNSGPLSKRTNAGSRARARCSRESRRPCRHRWSGPRRWPDTRGCTRRRRSTASTCGDRRWCRTGSPAPTARSRDRTHRTDRGADPTVRLLALAIRHFESFLAPEALHPFVVDLPALSPQALGGTAPSPPCGPCRSPPAMPAARRRRPPALGVRAVASSGADQPPDTPAVARPELVAQHAHRAAPPIRVRSFPPRSP